jgi:FMN-binding domain
MKGILKTALVLLCFFLMSEQGHATVFYSKEEAFELAFGKGAEIVDHQVFLTDEQTVQIEQLAKTKLDSQLYTFFEARRSGQILGYAVIESHTVRTQPETLLIALSPKGELMKSEILAFHEPPEYKPSSAWFATLIGKPVNDLRQNQGVDGISGATLSVKASLEGIRKALAVFQIAMAPTLK